MFKFRATLADGRTAKGTLPAAKTAIDAMDQTKAKLTEGLKEKAGTVTRLQISYVSGKESFAIQDAPAPKKTPAKK